MHKKNNSAIPKHHVSPGKLTAPQSFRRLLTANGQWLMASLLLLLLSLSCTSSEDGPADTSRILSVIQQKADIVSTELTVRKIAIYDSGKHEKISISDPSTWKYGERKCIVPVTVTIRYGYDLRDLSLESIRVDDSTRIVHVLLPEPKVIDSGYATATEDDQVVRISTGLRTPVGHETVETIRREAYQSVMKEDFEELIGNDIRYNARTMLGSLVRSLGYAGVEIEGH